MGMGTYCVVSLLYFINGIVMAYVVNADYH